MKGANKALSRQTTGLPFLIHVESEQYSIADRRPPFPRTVDNSALQYWTGDVMALFQKVVQAISAMQSIDLRGEGVDLGGRTLAEMLRELAAEGRHAYREFFCEEARRVIRQKVEFYESMGLSGIVPIFESAALPYPWEMLYDGEIDDPQPLGFWGLRYPLGRNLTQADYSADRGELDPPPAMLFCVHRTLPFSFTEEWQGVRDLIQETGHGSARVLGASVGLQGEDERRRGVALLSYLLKAENRHNVLHFAGHCRRGVGEDVLSFTLVDGDDPARLEDKEKSGAFFDVELRTKETFKYVEGQFPYKPLVFLNACMTAGEPNPVHLTFNLPKQFVEHSAAAVIATLCPVPDRFACAFAREFYRNFFEEQWHIGEALRRTRLHFWESYGNPLGLAYGLYSSGYYRVGRGEEKEAPF